MKVCGRELLPAFASGYRSREWVEFTERFVPYCEDWNGCWVAEEAWREFTLYLCLPEGEYYPDEYPEGWDFRR